MLECIRNSAILWISHHPLEYSVKFREILIKIGAKFDEKRRKIAIFCRILGRNPKKFNEIFVKFQNWSGAKDCKSWSSRKMLQNAYLGAKIGFDAEENEPSKVWSFCLRIGVKFGIESFN